MAKVAESTPRIILVRHGETEWSANGRHTGKRDIPLTEKGREEAEAVRPYLKNKNVSAIFSSPASRALMTAKLAGFENPELLDQLMEWDYGDFEGLTTQQVRENHPGWFLWRDGCINGENVDQVGERADEVLKIVKRSAGDVLIFSHRHFLRVLAARWLDLDPRCGRLFALNTATVSNLSTEHDLPVIEIWNCPVTNS